MDHGPAIHCVGEIYRNLPTPWNLWECTMRRSFRSVSALAIAAATAVALAGAAGPTAFAQSSAAASGSQKGIVLLKDQLPGTPAAKGDSSNRRNHAKSAQDSVLGRLAGAKPTKVTHFTLGNAFAATVTAAQAADLARDPAVASVVPDSEVKLPAPATPTAPGAGGAAHGA